MLQDLVYVGKASATSKKGSQFYKAFFYGSGRPDFVRDGYQVFDMFVDKDIYDSLTMKPLSAVSADVRYIGGQNVLISVTGK